MAKQEFQQSAGQPLPGVRLRAAAALVRPGRVVADIGTDHGYLPAYLVQAGICPFAYASDIRPGPLAKARETVQKYGLEKRVCCLLGDGLSQVPPGKAEDIVIAGMGGDMIAKIIAAAAWLQNPAVHLILQPMTAQDALRRWLCENGFSIQTETAVCEARHVYTVMSVYYIGRALAWDEVFLQVGRHMDSRDKASAAYMRRRAERLQKKVQGMERSAHSDPDAVRYYQRTIDTIIRMVERCENS
ncbi:MAG: class I SAM-dependent methyltransferase [Oscillospiraceae bacterium]